MNILQKKLPFYQTELKELYQILQFKNYKLELKGSSSLLSQKYPSDYDFYCNIPKFELKEFKQFINDLINRIKSSMYLYFIELKVEYKNDKIKYNKNDKIVLNNLNKIKMIKLDLIIYTNYKFKEVSIIYDFENKKNIEYYIKSIIQDIEKFFDIKDPKYFKIFKRLFSLAKIENNIQLMKSINHILNSDLGKLNQKLSNIETIQLLLKHYDDKITLERVNNNIKLLKITDKYENLRNELNKKSFELLKKLM